MLDRSIRIYHIDWMDCTPIIITNGGVDDKCFTIQTVSQFLEWIGLIRDGSPCGGRSPVGKQFCSGGADGFRDCCERMEKTLIKLRRLPLKEFDGFLIKMQTLEDIITDFMPPVSDCCVQQKISSHSCQQTIDFQTT